MYHWKVISRAHCMNAAQDFWSRKAAVGCVCKCTAGHLLCAYPTEQTLPAPSNGQAALRFQWSLDFS